MLISLRDTLELSEKRSDMTMRRRYIFDLSMIIFDIYFFNLVESGWMLIVGLRHNMKSKLQETCVKYGATPSILDVYTS